MEWKVTLIMRHEVKGLCFKPNSSSLPNFLLVADKSQDLADGHMAPGDTETAILDIVPVASGNPTQFFFNIKTQLSQIHKISIRSFLECNLSSKRKYRVSSNLIIQISVKMQAAPLGEKLTDSRNENIGHIPASLPIALDREITLSLVQFNEAKDLDRS